MTLPLYVAAVRAIMGERLGILIACAFPAVMWNMLVGQNGFLTAALIGLMLLTLDTRPIAAGVLLGLLTYKPQFGILFPIVLAANGQWRVIAAASVTTAALVAASAAVFGVARLGRLLHLAAGDERDHPRRRPRRAQQAAEPVRRLRAGSASARRQPSLRRGS